jgi:monomeric sarcosine oxidase
MKQFDAIVLGTGGIGAAAVYELARRGLRILGIDRFEPPHDRGSTHGQTRAIRQAYFEHPAYVPLLVESYRLWRELEQQAGQELLAEVGVLEVGPADRIVVRGVLRSAEVHNLAVEQLTAAEIEGRWPGLRVPDELVGVFDPRGGFLFVEDCVRAHLRGATAAGAQLLTDTEVHTWSATSHEVTVRTSAGEFAAARLIIAAGPWSAQLLSGIGVSLVPRRKSLFWFETASAKYDVASGFPVFLYELPFGVFYGFPKLDGRGVKVAQHSGGLDIADPMTARREIDPEEERSLVRFLATCLPEVSHRVTDHEACLYTMSPDEHFVVDRHPERANVVFAAGLSGHGYKFAPVLGKALADLTLEGATRLPIGFLSLARFRDSASCAGM